MLRNDAFCAMNKHTFSYDPTLGDIKSRIKQDPASLKPFILPCNVHFQVPPFTRESHFIAFLPCYSPLACRLDHGHQ